MESSVKQKIEKYHFESEEGTVPFCEAFLYEKDGVICNPDGTFEEGIPVDTPVAMLLADDRKLYGVIKDDSVVNPFANLLDFTEYFYHLTLSENREELARFAWVQMFENIMRDIELSYTQFYLPFTKEDEDYYQALYLEMTGEELGEFEDEEEEFCEEKDAWMQFDRARMERLLQEPFFEGYHFVREYYETQEYSRSYLGLELYVYLMAQAQAATVFPDEETADIRTIWLSFENMLQFWGKCYFAPIVQVYKEKGFRWFCQGADLDPEKFESAFMAIVGCSMSGLIPADKLKSDLMDVYSELLITLTIRGKIEENEELIHSFRFCLERIDKEEKKAIEKEMSHLAKINAGLTIDNTKLQDGLEQLRGQMSGLQAESAKTEEEKVEELAHRLYCLSPQDTGIDEKVRQFEQVWGLLSDVTKKDIKVSISMYETYNSFDLALLPMIRSLEREFAIHCFLPFFESEAYKKGGPWFCMDRQYEKTHSALLHSHVPPTMGSIPFIGKCVVNRQACKASNLISAFTAYLGEKKQQFADICNTLYEYKIGAKHYRLYEIRNGIAHGDSAITDNVDERSYKEVAKLLYDPPLQILFQIVRF